MKNSIKFSIRFLSLFTVVISYTTVILLASKMIDTVNGLFSGRILFEGVKIAVGKSVLDICPVDVEREERLIGKKIYLA